MEVAKSERFVPVPVFPERHRIRSTTTSRESKATWRDADVGLVGFQAP